MAEAEKNRNKDNGRDGPRPVNLHMLATSWLLTAAAMPWLAKPEQAQAVQQVISAMANRMMSGLNAYKAAPVAPYAPEYKVLWQQGGSRLLQAGPAGGVPVLLVPSLINGYEILDLDSGHSFAAFLSGQGFTPYILAWGAPQQAEQVFSVNTYIESRLLPALRFLKSGCGKPHVIGYCMGGTMAAGALAALENAAAYARTLTLLAAPWDFHAGDKAMALRMDAFLNAAEPVMEAANVLPVDWIQAMFATIDPLFAFNKFTAYAGMDKTTPEARRFVLVEDWLGGGADLAAPAARQALREWYVENQPVNGVWTIGANLVDVARINVPVFVVAAANDKLVPAPSALAIVQQIAACDSISPAIGHIGMMASPRAANLVWQPVSDWLRAR